MIYIHTFYTRSFLEVSHRPTKGKRMNLKHSRNLFLFITAILIGSVLTGCSVSSTTILQTNSSCSYEEQYTIPEKTWNLCIAEFGSLNAARSYIQSIDPTAEVTIKKDLSHNSIIVKKKHVFKNAKDFRRFMIGFHKISINFQPAYFSQCQIYMPVKGEKDTSWTEELEALFGHNSKLVKSLKTELSNVKLQTSVVFPSPVTETNGNVQTDGRTVIWDTAQKPADRLYALFHTQNTKKAPVFLGAANGKSYNTSIEVSITSENLLRQVMVNGNDVQSDYLFLSDEGRYQITATDIYHNSKKIIFRIDQTAPVVSGVANNKTYKKSRLIKFSDKGSGIYKATLNGKDIKSGTTVSRKGDYRLVVKDHAGNQRSIRFKIK